MPAELTKYKYQKALFEMQSQNVATKNGLNIFEHFYASNVYHAYLFVSWGSNVYDTSKT